MVRSLEQGVMSGEVEKCPILHVCPKFDVFTLYIQERALILENIAYSCNCKIEDRKLDVQPRLSVRQSVYLSVYLFIYPSVNPLIPRNQNQIKSRSLVRLKTGPQGFGDLGRITQVNRMSRSRRVLATGGK